MWMRVGWFFSVKNPPRLCFSPTKNVHSFACSFTTGKLENDEYCSSAIHLLCAGMLTVPDGEWLCRSCVQRRRPKGSSSTTSSPVKPSKSIKKKVTVTSPPRRSSPRKQAAAQAAAKKKGEKRGRSEMNKKEGVKAAKRLVSDGDSTDEEHVGDGGDTRGDKRSDAIVLDDIESEHNSNSDSSEAGGKRKRGKRKVRTPLKLQSSGSEDDDAVTDVEDAVIASPTKKQKR